MNTTTTIDELAATAREMQAAAQAAEDERLRVAAARRRTAHAMRDAGMTYRAIAAETGVSLGTVQRLLAS